MHDRPTPDAPTSDPADRWSEARSFADEYEERTVRLGALDFSYTDWNSGAPDTVLMIHGYNVQGHTWDPIASEFARRARVIVPDLRGHGRSSWALDGYHVLDFVGDLVRLLDHLGVERCKIVGHSLGARIALALGGEHPARAERIVLSDNGPELPRAAALRSKGVADRRAARRGFRDTDEALEFYRSEHPAWKPVFHALHVQHQLRLNWAGKLIERSDPDLFWVTRGAGAEDDAVIWALAAHVTAPVLLVWGESSPYMNEELADKMSAVIPTFEHRRMPCGHYIPREMPDEFLDLTAAFLGLA